MLPEVRSAGERTDTDLVLAVTGGDASAFGELFDRWFNSSWNVARTIVRNDDLAADVAQDALLTAWQRLGQLENPDAFGGWLLRITRNRALNRLERENRSKATGDDVVSGLRDAGAPDPTGAERPLGPETISEVRDRQELVWAAASALGEKETSLLDLHLRHGLGPAEIAEELGVEANNAHQQLYRLRTKLGDAIGSYLLWRNGRPLCEGLAKAVSGDVAFDKSVARAVARHQKNCEDCSKRRSGLVDPAKLFAGVPLVLVPSHLKVEAAAALQSAGVPVGDGGAAGSGGAGSGSGPDGGLGANSGSATPVSSGGAAPAGTPATAGGGMPNTILSGAAAGGADKSPLGGWTVHSETNLGPELSLVTTSSKAAVKAAGPGKGLILAGAGIATVVVAGLLTLLVLNNGGQDETATAAALQAGLEADVPGGDDQQELLAPAGPSDGEGDGPATQGDFASPGDDDGAPSDQSAGQPGPGVASPSGDEPPQDDQSTPDPGEQNEPPGSDDGPTTTLPPSTTEPEGPTTTSRPEPDTTTTTEPPDPTTTETTATTVTTVTVPDPDTTTTTVDPPDTTDPDGDTTTTIEVVEEPRIIRFTSRRPNDPTLLCQDRTKSPYEVLWVTEHADKGELDIDGVTRAVAANGSHRFCGSKGEVVRLLVTGPGGEDKDTTTL